MPRRGIARGVMCARMARYALCAMAAMSLGKVEVTATRFAVARFMPRFVPAQCRL